MVIFACIETQYSLSEKWTGDHYLLSHNTKYSAVVYPAMMFEEAFFTTTSNLFVPEPKDLPMDDTELLHKNKLELIPWCQFDMSQSHKDCTGMFFHEPTALGVCSTLNGPALQEVCLVHRTALGG